MTPICAAICHIQIQECSSLPNQALVKDICKLGALFSQTLIEEVATPWLEPSSLELWQIFGLGGRHFLEPLVVRSR
jgi:hypothetical protein